MYCPCCPLSLSNNLYHLTVEFQTWRKGKHFQGFSQIFWLANCGKSYIRSLMALKNRVHLMHPAHPVRRLLFRLFSCPWPQVPATMASYGIGLEVVGQRHQIVFAAFCGYERPPSTPGRPYVAA